MTIEEIAKAAATEIECERWNHRIGEAELSDETVRQWAHIIVKHFAPLDEQLDNLLFLVNSVRKLHRAEELGGSPFTHCRCNVCNYIRSAGEADGKEVKA